LICDELPLRNTEEISVKFSVSVAIRALNQSPIVGWNSEKESLRLFNNCFYFFEVSGKFKKEQTRKAYDKSLIESLPKYIDIEISTSRGFPNE